MLQSVHSLPWTMSSASQSWMMTIQSLWTTNFKTWLMSRSWPGYRRRVCRLLDNYPLHYISIWEYLLIWIKSLTGQDVHIQSSVYMCSGLRQEYATTSATGARRSSSFSVHSGLRRPERTDVRMEDDDEDFDDLPPPQPRLFRTGSMQRSVSHSHNLSSLREPRRCSSSSTQYLSSPCPSTASYSSTETQGYRTSTGQQCVQLLLLGNFSAAQNKAFECNFCMVTDLQTDT